MFDVDLILPSDSEEGVDDEDEGEEGVDGESGASSDCIMRIQN